MSKQTGDVDQLRAEIRGLEDQLKMAKENERLLVEYPDLHYVNNSPVSIAGTGDLAEDMQNQMKANSLRIEVLERENCKLNKSVSKLLGANNASTVASRHGSAPVQLWNYNANNTDGAGRTVLAWTDMTQDTKHSQLSVAGQPAGELSTYTCSKCDKVYSSRRELVIHQSYCCAQL